MGVAQAHMQTEHGTTEVHFDLAAACTCGTTMVLESSRPTGGGFKDYFVCPACANTGFVRRES